MAENMKPPPGAASHRHQKFPPRGDQAEKQNPPPGAIPPPQVYYETQSMYFRADVCVCVSLFACLLVFVVCRFAYW